MNIIIKSISNSYDYEKRVFNLSKFIIFSVSEILYLAFRLTLSSAKIQLLTDSLFNDFEYIVEVIHENTI